MRGLSVRFEGWLEPAWRGLTWCTDQPGGGWGSDYIESQGLSISLPYIYIYYIHRLINECMFSLE
jgi:hypothetical protein